MKGDVTCVAIIELPSGSKLIKGAATKAYISDANGIPTKVKTTKNITTFKSLDLSSNKWLEMESLVIY